MEKLKKIALWDLWKNGFSNIGWSFSIFFCYQMLIICVKNCEDEEGVIIILLLPMMMYNNGFNKVL